MIEIFIYILILKFKQLISQTIWLKNLLLQNQLHQTLDGQISQLFIIFLFVLIKFFLAQYKYKYKYTNVKCNIKNMLKLI